MMIKPLIARPSIDPDDMGLDELFLRLAATIEDGLIESGATPGKDYTILDLYKLAQPFALHTYSLPEANVSFTARWP